MKLFFLALLTFVSAARSEDQAAQLKQLYAAADSVIHIQVAGSPIPNQDGKFRVTDISTIDIIKQKDSALGEIGTHHARTIVRIGELIDRSHWHIRHPGHYIVFCNMPLGDVDVSSGPRISVWNLPDGDSSWMRDIFRSAEGVEQDAAANP